MRREDEEHASRVRTIIYSEIEDDGWDLPKEIIHYVDFAIQETYEEAYARVCKQNEMHKGDWITLEDANKYRDMAYPYCVIYGNQYIGLVRELGNKLIRKYGIAEIEAFNILRGFHISDYVMKYDRIKKCIPIYPSQDAILNRAIEMTMAYAK